MSGAEPGADISDPEGARRPRLQRKRSQFLIAILLLLTVGLMILWFSRENIASNIIEEQLAANGLTGTYEIESIGPERQVIRDLVIGDPNDPDLVAERVIIRLRYRFGTPAIGRIEVEGARLFGRWDGKKVSFGSLDRIIYRDTGAEPGLPDLDLAVRDARASILVPGGPVGIALEGEGELDDGFAGRLAISAPGHQFGSCAVGRARGSGRITTAKGRATFAGPLRFVSLECKDGASLDRATLALELEAGETFDRFDLQTQVAASGITYADVAFADLVGSFTGSWRPERVRASYAFDARGMESVWAAADDLSAEGDLRANSRFEDITVTAALQVGGAQPNDSTRRALRRFAQAGSSTPFGPLAQKFTRNLSRHLHGANIQADLTFRRDADNTRLLIPRAALTNSSGTRIVDLSRVDFGLSGEAEGQVSGNIALRGPGMPRLSGRMEQRFRGAPVFRMRMAPYESAGASLSLPELTVTQGPDSARRFSGRARISGPIPDGRVDELQAPIQGWWNGSRLIAWDDCITPSFARLRYANLALDRSRIRLCPPDGSPILRFDGNGYALNAVASDLQLTGRLGETPVQLTGEAVRFSLPDEITATGLTAIIGRDGSAARFAIPRFDADMSDVPSGTFAGADFALEAVPLDFNSVEGAWTYADGRLALSDGSFILTDRQAASRFEPLLGRDASLSLEDNIILAEADLREPMTGRIVTQVDIRHNLADGQGVADLDLPGILFDEQLQPDRLTRLALGVVANTEGMVTGDARIEWGPNGVTSTGAFSSDDLDFAAAFGPVEGAAGTIRFTDLLGLTTAPDQRLQVRSVNPGIEVLDGEVALSLRDGEALVVEGGTWPFMGGTLTMRPVTLNIGRAETRRYAFILEGLEAARFIEELGIENLNATGTFDGTIAVEFESDGDGFVRGGVLTSRPPGGNIAYVGELTYADLSPIANFAFDALLSLDYRQMTVGMAGPLTGEIVTTVRFDGVRQGEGAARNFITREIGKLPLRFIVNIRAPFYQLASSMRSLYDPAFVRDPRELGLTEAGDSIRGENVPEPNIEPSDLVPEPDVQSPESEAMP